MIIIKSEDCYTTVQQLATHLYDFVGYIDNIKITSRTWQNLYVERWLSELQNIFRNNAFARMSWKSAGMLEEGQSTNL